MDADATTPPVVPVELVFVLPPVEVVVNPLVVDVLVDPVVLIDPVVPVVVPPVVVDMFPVVLVPLLPPPLVPPESVLELKVNVVGAVTAPGDPLNPSVTVLFGAMVLLYDSWISTYRLPSC